MFLFFFYKLFFVINFTGQKVVNMRKQVSGVYKLMFVHISNNSRASTTLQAAAGGFIIAYLIRCFRPIAYQSTDSA